MSVGRGDTIKFQSATTTSAFAVGNVLTFVGGYVDTQFGSSPTTAVGKEQVAGVCLSTKAAGSSSARTNLLVQQSGLVPVKVTSEQGATVIGQMLVLSQTTANLGTVAATLGSTAAHNGYHPNLIGFVVVAAASTGATTSTATTQAIVRLCLGR